jgi:cytochrome P450
LPLLQSLFQEVLRLYTDALVVRELKDDIVLPFDEGKKSMVFRSGTDIMVPTYLGHHDTKLWMDPPSETFYAERFLKFNPETGKETFSMTGTNGKLFPFGGGRTMCPGRVFAKQEVFAAVALTLLKFDFKPLGYQTLQGEEVNNFPELANVLGGSGIVPSNGDVKIRMKMRMR